MTRALALAVGQGLAPGGSGALASLGREASDFLGTTGRERNFRNRLAGIAHKSHRGLHGDGHSLSRNNFQERALIKALDFQHGLVGLDFKKDVALGDRFAHLLAPAGRS